MKQICYEIRWIYAHIFSFNNFVSFIDQPLLHYVVLFKTRPKTKPTHSTLQTRFGWERKKEEKKQLNYQLFEQKTKLNHFLGLLGWVERLLSWIDPPKVHVLVYLHTWLERVRRKQKKSERRISVLSTGSKYLNTFILLFRRIHYQLTRAFDHHRVV